MSRDRYNIDITARNKAQKAFDQVNRSIDKTSKSMAFMKKSFVGLIGTAAIANFSKKALQTADDLAKVSSSIGVSAEFLQRFQFAAEQSGVSAEGFDKSLRFFSKTMGEATMGLGLGLDAVDQLGVSLKDTEGKTKSIDDLFIEFMTALDGVSNATEKAGLATKLFGRAGIPMVNMIRDGTEEMMALAKVAPGVLTDEDTKRAEEFNDAMNVLSRTIQGPLMSAVINLTNLPDTIFGDWLGGNLDNNTSALDGFGKKLKETNESIFIAKTGFFGWIGNAALSAFDKFLKKQEETKENFAEFEDLFGRRKINKVKVGEDSPVNPETLKTVDKRLMSFAQRVTDSLKTAEQKVAEFREELELAVKEGIFDPTKLDEAVNNFKESLSKGVTEGVTIVKQFEDTIEGALTGAFENFFDSTSEGFLKLKNLMKSVIDAIIQEVLRLAVIDPIVKMIMSSGPMKGLSSIFGKRAMGGPITAGKSYLVGERGPEIITAGANGRVLPNGSTGGVVINQSINFSTGLVPTVRAEVMGLMPQIAEVTKAAVSEAAMSSPSYRRTLQGA